MTDYGSIDGKTCEWLHRKWMRSQSDNTDFCDYDDTGGIMRCSVHRFTTSTLNRRRAGLSTGTADTGDSLGLQGSARTGSGSKSPRSHRCVRNSRERA